MTENKYRSDKVLKCPMCGSQMCVTDEVSERSIDENTPDYIIFEYNCSNPECGMLGYYPVLVSEMKNGKEYF